MQRLALAKSAVRSFDLSTLLFIMNEIRVFIPKLNIFYINDKLSVSNSIRFR